MYGRAEHTGKYMNAYKVMAWHGSLMTNIVYENPV